MLYDKIKFFQGQIMRALLFWTLFLTLRRRKLLLGV